MYLSLLDGVGCFILVTRKYSHKYYSQAKKSTVSFACDYIDFLQLAERDKLKSGFDGGSMVPRCNINKNCLMESRLKVRQHLRVSPVSYDEIPVTYIA